MLRVLLAAVAAAATLAVGALPAGARTSAALRATVTLKDIAFKPGKVTIRRGGTVTFRWADGAAAHNVTPTGHGPRLRRLATRKAGTATVRLRRRGTYRFICTIHPGMSGRIVVR